MVFVNQMSALTVIAEVLVIVGAILRVNGSIVQKLLDILQADINVETIINADRMGTIICGVIWRRAVGTIVR